MTSKDKGAYPSIYKFVDLESFNFSIFSRNDNSLGSLPLKSDPEMVDMESEAR